MTPDTARDDLAYLRALVQGTDSLPRGFGRAYAAAGLCYGVQFLLHGAQAMGWATGDRLSLAIGLGPTVVFLALLMWIIARDRREGAGGGVTFRAVRSVFSAVGFANIAAAVIVGSVALREHSLTIWLIFPCIIMVFQGAAWLVAFVLWRQRWFGLVASGWFAAGIAAGLFVGMTPAYLIVSGLAFLAFMLAPGVILMRRPRAA